MLWIVDLSLRRIGGTVPSTDPRVARKWLIVFRLVKAKFHYTDPTRTGHGQSPRTLSGTS